MSKQLADQVQTEPIPQIPARVIFESGDFRISSISANKFVVSIGKVHHKLTGGQAQNMFEALSEHFRESDGERVTVWDSNRRFEPTEGELARFRDDCANAYTERMYGGKKDWML